MIRHPLDRFVSMYHFTVRVKSAWHKRYATDFETWAKAFFDNPGENLQWQMNLTDIAHVFRPQEFIRLEYLNSDCFRVLGVHNPSHINRTVDRPAYEDSLDELTPETRALVEDWAMPDLRSWYDGTRSLNQFTA